jgi:hypothetical protein
VCKDVHYEVCKDVHIPKEVSEMSQCCMCVRIRNVRVSTNLLTKISKHLLATPSPSTEFPERTCPLTADLALQSCLLISLHASTATPNVNDMSCVPIHFIHVQFETSLLSLNHY